MQRATDDLPKDGHFSASIPSTPYILAETYTRRTCEQRKYEHYETPYLKVLLVPPLLPEEPDDHLRIKVINGTFHPTCHLFKGCQSCFPIRICEPCDEVLGDHVRSQCISVFWRVFEFEVIKCARTRRNWGTFRGLRRSGSCRSCYRLLCWGRAGRPTSLRTTGCCRRRLLCLKTTIEYAEKL